MKKFVLSALLLLAQPGFALAQTPGGQCSSTEHLLSQLKGPKYQEKGLLELIAGQQKLQLYANMETGTWSLVLFYNNGAACIMASGNSVEPMGEVKKGNDT